jgi:hypothetical protein
LTETEKSVTSHSEALNATDLFAITNPTVTVVVAAVMNILAELPAVVTRRLLVEWMDIVDVSRLDAAMLARFHPSALRTVLWSSQPAISSERGHPTNKENTESYMRWLLKRNIKVNCVRLDNGCSRIALSEFLITCGNPVTEISLNQACFGRDVADLVVNSCPKLKAITVKSKKMRLVKLARAVYSEATVKKEVNQDRGITLLAHGCPHLVYVNLAFMDVTDTAIRTLCEKCPKMEYLDLHGCNLNGFTARYDVLTQLLFLDLSHTQCTAVVVRSVAKCQTLRCLKLGHKMDDAVMAEITTHCPNLTDFAIPMWIGEPHACTITRATLEVFAQHHPRLRTYITPHLFSRIENVPLYKAYRRGSPSGVRTISEIMAGWNRIGTAKAPLSLMNDYVC